MEIVVFTRQLFLNIKSISSVPVFSSNTDIGYVLIVIEVVNKHVLYQYLLFLEMIFLEFVRAHPFSLTSAGRAGILFYLRMFEFRGNKSS